MYTFTLPNGIALNGKLYNKATIDEMTGLQQDYLVNPNYKSSVAHIKPILNDLLESVTTQDDHKLEVVDSKRSDFHKANIESIVLDYLSIEDLQFLLIKLREVTFGTNLFLNRPTCPHCNTKHSRDPKIELDKLEVFNKGFNALEEHSTILPKSEKKVIYRSMTLRNLIAEQSDINKLFSNMSTLTAFMCVKSIDDQEPTHEDFKAMKSLDIKHVQNNYPEFNHIDSVVTHVCENHECAKEWNEDLDILNPTFFSPTKI
jgi:hypothetical protein